MSHGEPWRLTAGELGRRIETNASIPWKRFALAWLRLAGWDEALNAVVASGCDGT